MKGINQPQPASKKKAFSLRFSERKLLLGIGDVLIINIVLILLARQYILGFTLSLEGILDHMSWFVILTGLWLIFGSFLSIYDLAYAANPVRSVWTTGGTAILTGTIYILIPYLTPALPGRRLYIFLLPVIIALGVAAWRLFYATVFAQPAFRHRSLAIGAGQAGSTLARIIAETELGNGRSSDGVGYEIVGFVDDDPAKQGQLVAGVPVLGSSSDLLSLVEEWTPDELVISLTHWQGMSTELFQTILDCRERGMPVTTMASLYERITGRVPVEHVGRNLPVVLPISRPAAFRVYQFVRSLVDFALAVIGCLFLLIMIPIVWLANKIASPGTLFYRQTRVGMAGRDFTVIKFRTMVMDAEEQTGAIWAAEDDPRTTAIGRWLRRTRIDEVPQFWNILKGEMSLIGPRPERPHFVEHLSADIPYYRLRHAIRPGITGWAQVRYRYGASAEDALTKLEYDLYYIKHQSFYLDLQILLKTIQVTLGLKGR